MLESITNPRRSNPGKQYPAYDHLYNSETMAVVPRLSIFGTHFSGRAAYHRMQTLYPSQVASRDTT